MKEETAHVASSQEFINTTPYIPEPKSIKQILKITDPKIRAQWIEATRRELKTITEHTFNLDGQPLPGEQIIPLLFIFKAKMNSSGGLDKLKSRLCARGDLQNIEGVDIFSPTASMRLLKLFLALSVEVKRIIKQLDYISAYIQGKVRSRIFVS